MGVDHAPPGGDTRTSRCHGRHTRDGAIRRMHARRWSLLLMLPWLLLAAPVLAGGTPDEKAERRASDARALVEKAVSHLARNDVNSRHAAIIELEQATQLEPDEVDYELLLGRCYYAAGYVRAAQRRFERVVDLAPSDPAGHFGMGEVQRRDWLKFLDTTSLNRAVDEFATAARLDSGMVEAWLMLSSMRIESHDTTGAAAAALRALSAAPDRAETQLAVAATQWRLGEVAEADSRFRAAIPRLPANVRERFDDIAPLASEADTALYNHLPPARRAEFARRFWAEHDPDLATPENEAQLEYWSRVTQAYFLYYNARHREWDERGEVYVRYGPPEKLDYNPIGTYLYSQIGDSRLRYPMNVLIWDYPSLGMTVELQDRVLSEYYLLPIAKGYDPDPRPEPDSLAKLAAVSTHQLRGVFPALPPRALPVRMQGEVAHFEGPEGPRFWAALEAESEPGDSLRAEMVVMDSTEHEVMRTSRALAPSACEAGRFRVADFAGELPPGQYRVGLSVRAGARRGSERIELTVPRADSTLALSDVVVTCGVPIVMGPVVRLDPNPLARVPADAPLSAYFEIYGLEPGTDGESRFQYVYTIKSRARDARVWLQRALSPRPATPSVEISRVESNEGGLRRQFVTLPASELPPPGRYRLEIVVHDLVSGRDATASADFTRLSPGS